MGQNSEDPRVKLDFNRTRNSERTENVPRTLRSRDSVPDPSSTRTEIGTTDRARAGCSRVPPTRPSVLSDLRTPTGHTSTADTVRIFSMPPPSLGLRLRLRATTLTRPGQRSDRDLKLGKLFPNPFY